MASPQTGIFALGTNSHACLELDFVADAQPSDAVARVAALREPRTTIGGVNLVSGFRPELWEQLPVATQEGFIGRRKADSAELDPLPPASHIARTDQELLGKIFRRNIACGTLTRHGTIFVGFSRDEGRLRAMLVSMLGVDGGPPDKLLAVTRKLTGAYYVIPSVDALAAFHEHLGAMPVVGVEGGA